MGKCEGWEWLGEGKIKVRGSPPSGGGGISLPERFCAKFWAADFKKVSRLTLGTAI